METKKTVEIIKASKNVENNKENKIYKKKVCAYCRVSTEHEEQITSYDAQVLYYTKSIIENPEYEFVKIYADRGISGTSTKNRTEFNNMIEDCKNGKIDLIITKSISRFARNIVDCITYTRLLKDMNIEVFFEKENIRTLDQTGEFVLTILGGLAQEESRNISKNTSWGIRARFKDGQPKINHNMFLGYTKDINGNLIIEEKEAEIVKLIFKLYIDGYSLSNIKNYLQDNGIKTLKGNSIWYESNILQILKNEKYKGDVLLQKYFTVDFMNKKSKKNEGELNQYYVESNHEPIINKEIFEKVQLMIEKRGKKSSTKYALSDILKCSECGNKYRRTIWKNKKSETTAVWRCSERIRNGNRNCKESVSIHENELHTLIINKLSEFINIEEIKKIVINNLNLNVNLENFIIEYDDSIIRKFCENIIIKNKNDLEINYLKK